MKSFLFALLIVFPSVGFASYVPSTKITKVLLGEAYGDKAFIELETKPDIPSDHCQSNPNFSYVFDISTELGKATLSVVLSAYMAQKNVYVNGFDTCTIYSGVENLRQIQLQ